MHEPHFEGRLVRTERGTESAAKPSSELRSTGLPFAAEPRVEGILPSRRSVLRGAAVAGAALWLPGLSGQDTPEKDKPLAPEEVSFETADGITLRGTFYPSKKGKEAVPVLMLHDLVDKKDVATRKVYAELALQLQAKGCACLAFDFRGFGDSTATANGRNLAPKDINRNQMQAMASSFGKGGGDMETAKLFLMPRNNAGELNINKLTIVAAGHSVPVAINWSALDWSWPPLPGRPKQGQDIKALALLSPSWAYKGYSIDQVINGNVAVQRELSVMICVGEGSKSAQNLKEAKQIYDRLKVYHHDPDPAKPDEFREKKDLFWDPHKTDFQGSDLLGKKQIGLEARIERFIELRSMTRPYNWSDRT